MFFSNYSEETLEYIFGGAYTREDALQLSDSLLNDAARVLCHELLFTTEQFLHDFNLDGIHDDYFSLEEGYSFLSDFRNDFSHDAWTCDIQANIWSKPGMLAEERAILNCLHEARFPVQPDEVPHPLVQQYEARVNEFLEYLILLILLSGEQPDGELHVCQGFVSELVSLRFANGEGAPRHITVQSGKVVVTTPDHLAYLGQPLRVRILPSHIGRMTAAYLLHVRPFLAKISPHHPAVMSNFLFPTAQGHWHTDSYIALIPRESQLRLNKTLVLENINDVHIRHLKETYPEMLTQAMWERLNVDLGSYSWPLGASEQLPSSEILQQLRTQQFRTPSPSFSEASSFGVQYSDGTHFALPDIPPVTSIKTSFSCWTPSSSPDTVADSATSSYFSAAPSYQHYSFSSSGHSSIAGSAPPSPVRKQPYIEPQGSITRLAFIDGYPKQARKHTTNPKSGPKKKNNKDKSSKVLNNILTKKSPKVVKSGRCSARSQSRQSDEDDDNASSARSVKGADMILENLGLTSSILKSETQELDGLHLEDKEKGVNDPIKHADRILSNMRLQSLVTATK